MRAPEWSHYRFLLLFPLASEQLFLPLCVYAAQINFKWSADTVCVCECVCISVHFLGKSVFAPKCFPCPHVVVTVFVCVRLMWVCVCLYRLEEMECSWTQTNTVDLYTHRPDRRSPLTHTPNTRTSTCSLVFSGWKTEVMQKLNFTGKTLQKYRSRSSL